MEAKRLNWDYVLKLKKGHAQSYAKLEYYKKLYHKENITASWLALSTKKVRAMLSKKGWYVLNQNLVQSQQGEGDIHALEAVFYYEMLKAHFRMRDEHASFLHYLQAFCRQAAASGVAV
jgi:hypothetical protein